MTWFKVDDTLHSHKKAMRAGIEAMGLWVLAGSWAADQLTNGWVPDYAVMRWASNAAELAERLVSAGFWVQGEHDGETGWWFHQWDERQPTKQEVMARRKADAERRARWRDAKKQGLSGHESQGESRRDATRDDTRESQEASRGASALPDPTRPDPTKNSSSKSSSKRSSNGGTSPARTRTSLEEVIGTAHSPAAHKFVTAYAAQCATRPPADVLAKLGPKVDQLLAAGYTDTQITQSLTEWGRKGIGTHLLTEIAHELVNSDRGRHLRPVEDIPDEELTREFLERELGPDYERITAPREIEFGDPAARQAWYRDANRKRLEERRAEYRRRASRAQNRTPA